MSTRDGNGGLLADQLRDHALHPLPSSHEHPFLALITLVVGADNMKDWLKKLMVMCCFQGALLLTALLDYSFGEGACKPSALSCQPYRSYRPRDVHSLPWVLVGPLVHSSLWAYLSTATPLFVLGMCVLLRPEGLHVFWSLVISQTIIGGLMTWLVGRSGVSHMGSAGLVFAFFGFLLSFGYFGRQIRPALMAIVLFVLYGGLLWSLWPSELSTVSWENHTCGLVIGALAGAAEAKGQAAAVREWLRSGLWTKKEAAIDEFEEEPFMTDSGTLSYED